MNQDTANLLLYALEISLMANSYCCMPHIAFACFIRTGLNLRVYEDRVRHDFGRSAYRQRLLTCKSDHCSRINAVAKRIINFVVFYYVLEVILVRNGFKY